LSVAEHGLTPNRGIYGVGVYFVRQIDRDKKYPRKQYGPYFISVELDLLEYAILDDDLSNQIFGETVSVKVQAERLGLKINARAPWGADYNLSKLRLPNPNRKYTSTDIGSLHSVFRDIGFKGVAYTGKRDGKCIVAYDTSTFKVTGYALEDSGDLEFKSINDVSKNQDQLSSYQKKYERQQLKNLRNRTLRYLKRRLEFALEPGWPFGRAHADREVEQTQKMIRAFESKQDNINPDELDEGYRNMYLSYFK
jgi:hypothetical protein